MRKFLLVLVCVLLCGTSYAQKKSIYVTTVSKDVNLTKNECKILNDQIQESLIESGQYDVRLVDGDASNVYSAQKLKELYYQHSGAVNTDEIKKLGNELGAELLCVVEIQPSMGEYYFRSAIYETESGRGNKIATFPDFKQLDDLSVTGIDNIRTLQAIGIILLHRLGLNEDPDLCKKCIDQLTSINQYKKNQKEEKNEKTVKTDTAAAFSSLFIPGLGLVLKGHNEGYAYLGAEAALCLGGVLTPEIMRKRYDAMRKAHGVSAQNKIAYTDRMVACRAVSISCGVCAGLLHIANVIHSVVAKPKENAKLRYEIVSIPTMDINGGSSLGIGASLAYRF